MKQLFFLLCVFCLCGCSGGKKEVVETTNNFFSAIKYDKQDAMFAIYPDIEQIGSWWKSDEIEFIEVKRLKRGEFSVTVDSRFTNGFGKSDVKAISIFLKRKKEGGYIIFDSKNLAADFNRENDIYYYALQVGCVDETKDETDQTIAPKMAGASYMMMLEKIELTAHLRQTVSVRDMSWERNYWGNGASGEALFVNLSGLDLPMPMYIVEFKDKRDGTVLANETGYITYDTFRNGTTEHISFYSSYTGGARWATVSLHIDETLLQKMESYIAREKYHSGNEYSDYLQSNSDEQYVPSPMLPNDSINSGTN